MKDQTRNLNPTAEAISAMYMYGREYANQGSGSMDFWDGLDESRKRMCRELVERIETTELTRLRAELSRMLEETQEAKALAVEIGDENKGLRAELEKAREAIRLIKKDAEVLQAAGGSTLLPDQRMLKNRLDGFVAAILEQSRAALAPAASGEKQE